MANRYIERCSAPLIIREMQIKAMMSYHRVPVGMAVIKGTRNKGWWGCEAEGTLMHWECKLLQALCRTVWWFFKKLKSELPYDPVILLLSIFLKKMKTLTRNPMDRGAWQATVRGVTRVRHDLVTKPPPTRNDIGSPIVTVALFIIAKVWKQPNIHQ